MIIYPHINITILLHGVIILTNIIFEWYLGENINIGGLILVIKVTRIRIAAKLGRFDCCR